MMKACHGFRRAIYSLLILALLFGFTPIGFAEDDADDPWAGVDDTIEEETESDANEEEEEVADSGFVEDVEVDTAEDTPLNGESKLEEAIALEKEEDAEKLSPRVQLERRLYREYGEYQEKRNREEEEIELRQQIFHERARYHVGIDFTFNDLGDFNFGNQVTDATGGMRGFQFHFKRFPVATTTWGRVGLGGVGGIIGNNRSGAHFKLRFINAGLRASYEGIFTTGQVFVPIFYLGYEYILNQTDVPAAEPSVTENFGTFVWGLGVFLNLNRADSRTGTQALVSVGIKKFDLALLYQNRVGDSDDRSSSSFSAGLRFEY